MTSHTPHYSIPYPDLTDTPDGATEMGNLASAVDTALNSTDTAATALSALVAAKSRGIGGQARATTTTTAGTTELQVLSTGALALEASTTYLLIATFLLTGGTSGNEIGGFIKTANTAGASSGQAFIPIASSGHGSGTVMGFYTTTSAEASHVFIASIKSSSANVTLNTPGSNLMCLRFCAAGIVGTA